MVENEVVETVRTQPSVVAWLALLIAIVALIVSVVAYNRSGKDIQDTTRDAVNSAAEEVEQATE